MRKLRHAPIPGSSATTAADVGAAVDAPVEVAVGEESEEVDMSRSSYSRGRIVDKATISNYRCVINDLPGDHATGPTDTQRDLPEETQR
jgi:hypothetical protein